MVTFLGVAIRMKTSKNSISSIFKNTEKAGGNTNWYKPFGKSLVLPAKGV